MSDKPSQTFIDLCLNGAVLPEEIDDFVDRWHEDPAGRSLPEFLGMSASEYELWLNDPDALGSVILSRRERRPLTQTVNDN